MFLVSFLRFKVKNASLAFYSYLLRCSSINAEYFGLFELRYALVVVLELSGVCCFVRLHGLARRRRACCACSFAAPVFFFYFFL